MELGARFAAAVLLGGGLFMFRYSSKNVEREVIVEPIETALVTVESREVSEFVAREELEQMSDDPKEDARRALLQDQHDREIRELLAERKALRDENTILARRVRGTKTGLTRKLDTLEWWVKALAFMLVLIMFGGSESGKTVILFIIQVLSKGATK